MYSQDNTHINFALNAKLKKVYHYRKYKRLGILFIIKHISILSRHPKMVIWISKFVSIALSRHRWRMCGWYLKLLNEQKSMKSRVSTQKLCTRIPKDCFWLLT